MVTQKDYDRDLNNMLEATRGWCAKNPGVELLFRPLGYSDDTCVLAGLTPKVIRRVSGNDKTRELLTVMDAATRNQGTILMAESCLEVVFGLSRAISGLDKTNVN